MFFNPNIVAGSGGSCEGQCQDGVTPNIMIGDVETLAPGEMATVERRGSKENPIFDFGIPQGDKGIFLGSPEEAPESADLVIDSFDLDIITDGITPNLTVGEVRTLAPGSEAIVEITGTKKEPVLNFGLPAGDGATIDDNVLSTRKTWSSSKIEDFVLNNVGALWQEIVGGSQSVIDNTMEGFLRGIEIAGNTIQNPEDLSDIQHLGVWNEEKQGYEIEICASNNSSSEDLNYQEFRTTITLPCQLMKVGNTKDRLYWDKDRGRYVIEKNTKCFFATGVTRGTSEKDNFVWFKRLDNISAKDNTLIIDNPLYIGDRDSDWVNLKVTSEFYYEKGYTLSDSEAKRFLADYPVNVICATKVVSELIETEIREEIRIPTFLNHTYLSVSSGEVEGYITAKAPVDGGQVINKLEIKTQEQEEAIMTLTSITRETLNLVSPLLISTLNENQAGDSKEEILNSYGKLIKRNLIDINEVPSFIKEELNNRKGSELD